MIISINTCLYRYDLTESPDIWDYSYHSWEYSVNISGTVSYKNQAGLLFFFESENVTIKTAEQALRRYGINEFWITKTFVNKTIELLDLRGGETLVILNNLVNKGIDVFNANLTVNGLQDSVLLKSLKILYDYLMQTGEGGEEYKEKWLKLHEPFIYPRCPYGLLGQRLTDFNNGEVFKTLLLSKGFQGYIFDESYGGSTICLFSHNFISKPIKDKFDFEKLFEWNKKYYLQR